MHAESRPYPLSNGSEILIGTVRPVYPQVWHAVLRLFVLVVLFFEGLPRKYDPPVPPSSAFWQHWNAAISQKVNLEAFDFGSSDGRRARAEAFYCALVQRVEAQRV